MDKTNKSKYLTAAIFCCLMTVNQTSAQIVFKTPQAAANALYAAWQTKNKSKAKLAADNKAVVKLFGVRFQPKWKFAGCNDSSDTEKGLFQCVYKDKSDDLLSIAFDVFKTKKGWRVRSLTFGAEN